jgi:ABC-type multidrug transport system fused ATPase/permease subunit
MKNRAVHRMMVRSRLFSTEESDLPRRNATSEGQLGSLTPAIGFRNVDFSYDDNKVLDALSFQLARREIKIILSGSGGGKSTILKLILGLLKPDAGQILIDGEEISEYGEPDLQRVRDKIGMVFQEGALFDSLVSIESDDPYIHEFIRGTELWPVGP